MKKGGSDRRSDSGRSSTVRSRSSRAKKKKKELDVDGAKKRLRGLRMVCKKTEWALENRREKKPDHANSWGEEGQG